jgi:glycerophosphoryl diester phosphodiesterase
MSLFDRIEPILLNALDRACAGAPRARPAPDALRRCRIVAHRGAHDPDRVPENTLAAFDAAAACGVWGIEFDIRWTRDFVPVVIHDPDLKRVFGRQELVSRCTAQELAALCPLVPRLSDLIERYGGRMHLMAEIKAEPYPDLPRQNRILQELFAGLIPGEDFHLLALDPALFRLAPFVPPGARLPVARFNAPSLSRLAARAGYAGVAGHYLAIGEGIIRRQHGGGRKVGTGYAASQSVLVREIRRGVDWVFSNHAERMQTMLRALQTAGRTAEAPRSADAR